MSTKVLPEECRQRDGHIEPDAMCVCGHAAFEHDTCGFCDAPLGGWCWVGYHPYETKLKTNRHTCRARCRNFQEARHDQQDHR